ncbi:ABC transporter ATP-binding protein [Priestia megaterium]|jgi:ABC-2 type transport system ATP-binding protein|uniref:ABC transporter ATP-binding protein n=1 Tax=Priestia megaterium TaxID=1404 RepID=UPI002A6A5365|nr:ABC transporter ATP-binding protein [Priestia megaterium]MDY0941156.1 ABC transporter ATP-binding protein [Priestia megaterium]
MFMQVEGLTKTYRNITVVNNLSFNLDKGKCVALLGPNGAGKTTTLHMIAGLIAPDKGKISFKDKQHQDARSFIGFLPQHPTFFNWMTPQQYLNFVGLLSKISKNMLSQRIDEVLELVGLKGKEKRKIAGFSGGMKQRLGLAQALLHKPELLILDEPVSALDPEGRKDVLMIIETLKKDTTILFSTHILHDAEQMCDNIMMIKNGRMKWNGTKTSLRQEFTFPVFTIETEERLPASFDILPSEQMLLHSPYKATVHVKDKSQQQQLLQLIVDQQSNLILFEQRQHSLEDVYLEVMNK